LQVQLHEPPGPLQIGVALAGVWLAQSPAAQQVDDGMHDWPHWLKLLLQLQSHVDTPGVAQMGAAFGGAEHSPLEQQVALAMQTLPQRLKPLLQVKSHEPLGLHTGLAFDGGEQSCAVQQLVDEMQPLPHFLKLLLQA
jgi:hypothetical protein